MQRLAVFGHTLSVVAIVAVVGCGVDASAAPRSQTTKRDLTPPCSAPAPLLGAYTVPGVIVEFHDSVDPVAESARLAGRYSFTPKFVYTAALRGFAAVVSDSVVAALRCEATVKLMEHDAVVTAAGG